MSTDTRPLKAWVRDLRQQRKDVEEHMIKPMESIITQKKRNRPYSIESIERRNHSLMKSKQATSSLIESSLMLNHKQQKIVPEVIK